MKGLSPAKLKRIDAQLDRQNEQLLAEVNECRERKEHPDTGEQLTIYTCEVCMGNIPVLASVFGSWIIEATACYGERRRRFR